MASGRMLQKRISLNKTVNQLSCDTSRLMFTWTIPHLDKYGRIHGDPSVLKSIVFPRRVDVTEEAAETYIREWAERGLVVWYEADGDLWLQFPAFDRNQPGLRVDREPESGIPSPEEGKEVADKLPEDIRQTADKLPASIPPNVIKEKVREENTLSSAKPDANGSVPKEALKEIIDYLNEQTGKTFKTTTADTIHHISARWKEGRRVADFKTVVDIKVKTWCGDMEKYLRPATLFGPKFEAYLNEIPAQRVDNHAACPDCGDRLVAGHCMRCDPIGVKGENE